MAYWNKTAECGERSDLKILQDKRLIKTVERVYQNVEHYRNKMQQIGLLPGDIKGIDDLHKLPFTYKTDLRDTYPFGMFAVSKDEIVRIHASSGTTGKPIVVGYTKRDIDTWSEVCARALTGAGAGRHSMVQVAYGYGLFTGGLGMHYGVETIGATVIPASGGNTKRQLQMLKDYGTNIICCTPSYALYLAEELHTLGIKKSELSLKAGIFGAEMWTENMRREIEQQLGIKAYNIYGLSEISGPGVSCECECQNGMHVNEDYFYPEVIDPETGAVLPEGQKGELVFTTITKEGFPLIRYRTRDLTSLNYSKCDCGRTFVRMERVTGRSDDMLIIRGVNVFPSQVEAVLLELGETAPHYVLVVTRESNLDMLEIQVEMTQSMFSDKIKNIENLQKRISREIEGTLGISAKIKLVEPKSIQRSEGKATRVIDKRNLN